VYSFYGQHREEWRESCRVAFIEWKYRTRSFSVDITDFLQSNREWKYRNWIESHYTSDYYSLEMDLPQNWYSSRLAWHVVQSYSFSSYYPWLDPYVSYLRLFEKYEVMKFSDTLLNFYQLFNDMLEGGFVDFRTAMLGAYPLFYKFMPLYHPSFVLCNFDANRSISKPYVDALFGPMSDWSSLYLGGMIYQPFLRKADFFRTSFFRTYCLQQKKKLSDCNKSKKIHNTLVNGVRSID